MKKIVISIETKPTWGKNTSKKQPNRLKWKEIRNEIPKHLLHDNVKLRKRTPEEAMATPRSLLLEPEPQQPSYTPYSAGTGRISDLNDAEKAKLSQLIQQLVKVCLQWLDSLVVSVWVGGK